MRRNQRKSKPLLYLTGVVVMLFLATGVLATPAKKSDQKPVLSSLMKLQVPFVANEGQVSDQTVKYYTRTFGGNFYVRENGEMVYLLSSRPEKQDKLGLTQSDSRGEAKTTMFKEMLVDARKTSVEAKDPAATKVNTFIGNDPSKWKANLPTYDSVSLGEVYKGITVSLKAYGKRVEKVFTVQPGADPGAIKLKLEGATSLKVNEQGELDIETVLGLVRFTKPAAYQTRDGARTDVAVAYVADGKTYGFRTADYDSSLPLVIDPYLSYSTYLGGNSSDYGLGFAVDDVGSAYVTGWTYSADFPVENFYDSNKDKFSDVFVAKLNASGTALIYSTYLGGNGDDNGEEIAVDGAGSAYVVGWTGSTDFPPVNAYDSTLGGTVDAFVTKLDNDGGIVYSTYLGGSEYDHGKAIAVDPSGSAYVTGETSFSGTPDFPVLYAYDATFNGWVDVFVTKLSWDAIDTSLSLAYSTYLGGTSNDTVEGIAVDPSGSVYVTGYTLSPDFPPVNAYDSTLGGNSDAFVAKLSWDAIDTSLSLAYSTYLGGTSDEHGYGIAVDSSGNAYLTGQTYSPDFPAVNAYDSTIGGSLDAFVAKLNPSGTTLVYSTYLGGTSDEYGYGIAVDNSGNAYLTGETYSPDFPAVNAYESTLGGFGDAFMAILNASGDLFYSTYLGGNEYDLGYGIAVIAVDSSGDLYVYVAGNTASDNFPTRLDSFQPHFKGVAPSGDLFVLKLSPGEPDFEPPTFTILTTQYKPEESGTQPVLYPVNFQVRIEDPSGVYYNTSDPQWSIVLRQRNLLLNNFTYDASSDLTSGTLAYADDGTYFAAGGCYSVTIEAHDMLKNVGSVTLYFTVEDLENPDPETGFYPCPNPSIASPAVCLVDTEYDGIPDDGILLSNNEPATPEQQRTYGSEFYGSQEVVKPDNDSATNKLLRTLYIRPLLKQTDGSVVPWTEFATKHLPEVSKPFNQIGIELRPIMSLTYDPYTDPLAATLAYKPPISIVEVTYDLYTTEDANGNDFTSTAFNSMARQWYWGLLGLTPYETFECSNKNKYGYFRTTIYGKSIKKYIFEDRQYPTLEQSAAPTALQAPFQGASSPMNFGNDGTVEFNPFVFNDKGVIQTPVPTTTARQFTEDQVIQRLIAHEIGHTLLNASSGDHCSNPSCIMFGNVSSVAGWAISGTDTSGNPIGFGPPSKKTKCVHQLGQPYDLRPRVYNALNPILLQADYPCD